MRPAACSLRSLAQRVLPVFQHAVAMSRISSSTFPTGSETAAWEDVREVVTALSSTLEPGAMIVAIRDCLAARTHLAVEVFAAERERSQLQDYSGRPPEPLHPGLAAALHLHTGPVRVDPVWRPSAADRPMQAIGLRAGEELAGVAFLEAENLSADPSLEVVAALSGANLARAVRFDQLACLTGDSEHTRNLQQQILDHVSHEFNTPLMILRSSAGFAREASSDEERELFFDMHEQALDRLEELVRGVIEVAHTSAHGERRRLPIEEVVSELVLPHFIDDEWPDAVPALWHRPDPVEVEIEAQSLELALEHLLRNARDHAAVDGAKVAVAIFGGSRDRPGRSLEQALAALAADEQSLPPEVDRADTLWVEVIDTGRGIPAAELGMIFEPFTQASNSPLRGVSGAGMGLATATRLVESAGGRLEVESTLGSGSIFRIALPAA
jgi:signal transduction histidine kinase